MKNLHKKQISLLSGVVFCAIFLVAGIYIGYVRTPSVNKVFGVANQDPQVETSADFEAFWKVWKLINEKNPDAAKVSDQDKVYGAISGLVSSLNDPYSVFFAPKESKEFNESVNGSFSGVGMEVGLKDKVLTVIAPLKGTPAEKAGIKAGDQILKIDGTVTSNLTLDKAIDLIRGEKGTIVKLTIYRTIEKAPREVSVVRDSISIPTLDYKLRDDGIFVIQLYNFSANSQSLFADAIQKFSDSHSKKLIIDLRGNPGGYLDAAIDMASWFLPSDKIVVQEDFGNTTDKKVYRSKGYNIFPDDVKIVILADGGSASASEILAGALEQNGKATLVGEKTYGKGSVQELIPITSDTSLKITIAKWLTPNGTSISQQGLTPDVVVPITPNDIATHTDAQMNKAIQLLNK